MTTPPPEHRGPFRRRTAAIVAALAAVSLVGSLALVVFRDPEASAPSAAADTFSRSAVGHGVFAAFLREMNVPVAVSRFETARKASESTLLAVMEPSADFSDDENVAALREMIAAPGPTLVVLPKWSGTPDSRLPSRVAEVAPVSEARIEKLFGAIGVAARARREAEAEPASAFTADGIDGTPSIGEPQLVLSSEGMALFGTPRGALLMQFWVEEEIVYVLADPDLVSNHGIGRGENAAVALSLVDRLRGPGGVLLIDETLHGHEARPNLWRDLLRFPLVLPFLHALATAALLLLAGLSRFGDPIEPPPPFVPGKRPLIDGAAALLRAAGHDGLAIERYWRAAREDAAEAIHAPRGEDEESLTRRLEEWGERRGVAPGARAIAARVAAAAKARPRPGSALVVELARDIRHFKETIATGQSAAEDDDTR